jgi:tripartite-type tricarboxylate transporter receptor subunit TctC
MTANTVRRFFEHLLEFAVPRRDIKKVRELCTWIIRRCSFYGERRLRAVSRTCLEGARWRLIGSRRMQSSAGVSAVMLATVSMMMAAPPAEAQRAFPARPIEMVNPFGAGGDSDVSGRAAAKAAERHLGQPVVTVNRPGAGGAMGFAHLHASTPDGYTIGWLSSSLLTATNLGNVKFPYTDLQHLVLMARIPTVIAVRADAPWKGFAEFIKHAKSKPRAVRLGDSGTGSFTYVAAKALEDVTAAQFANVPVGVQRRVASLLGGEVEASIVHPGEVLAQYRGKQIRFLAISGPARSAQFPDVPTFKEIGADFRIENFRSVAAPKGTPKGIVAKLAAVFERASQEKEWLNVSANLGYEPAFLGTEAHAKFLAEQDARIRQVLQKVNIGK